MGTFIEKNIKRIIAAILIVGLCLVIEILFNYHSILEGYETIDLSASIQLNEDEGSSEEYKILFEDTKGIYIKQLKLTGKFEANYTYSVDTIQKNQFGKEIQKTYSDTVNTWFTDFYTDINAKVTSLEITLNKDGDSELISVSISNEFEINKYRMVFFLTLFILIYSILFETIFIKKIEWFFLMYSLLFGCLIIVTAQPVKNSWDEQIHFANIYEIASGKNVKWTQAALDIANMNVVNCNTKAEFAQLRNYLDANGEIVLTEERDNLGLSYADLAYIPMIIFLKLGMLLNLPFSALFEFGKLGNLLLYILVMFHAIRMAKIKKIFLACLSMMPTALFQATSYTYDTVVFSFITFGCVLVANQFVDSKKKICNYKQIAIAILLFVVGSLSKAIYIPILLLILLVPQIGQQKKQNKVILVTGIMAICLLVMITFVLPTISNTVSGNLSYGGDSRGGDTSTVRQILSMLENPIGSVKVLVGNIFQFDNFRNLGYASADNYFFGNLMLLNFASLGILPDKWCAVLIPLLVLTLLYNDNYAGNRKVFSLTKKIFMSFIGIGIVGLIWVSMYLSFTPVGEEQIAGVQARYYLPLLYLGAMIITTDKIGINISSERMAKLTLFLVTILEAFAIYDIILCGRLL